MEPRRLHKAKRIDNGEWVEGYYYNVRFQIETLVENTGVIRDLRGMDHTIDPKTLCQCTGIVDKNGKPIYEWDKISCIYLIDCELYNVLVHWCSDGLFYAIPGIGLHQVQNIEIIGNTYD